MDKIEPHYSLQTVAEKLELSAQTVRKYCLSGALRCVRFGNPESGPIRIPQSALNAFLGLPAPTTEQA